MATKQLALDDDFETTPSTGGSDDEPTWQPQGNTNPNRCENCGSHVTSSFIRVYGDSHGRVWGCTDCTDKSKLSREAPREERGYPNHPRQQSNQSGGLCDD